MGRTRVIRLELGSRALSNSRAFAALVRSVLRRLVVLNTEARLAGRVPPLYRSGVRFLPEPEWPERFRDAERTFALGRGDCAQLAAWLAADYRAKGENATLAVRWPKGRKTFHVLVRRADGRLEDPSSVLDSR